MTSIVAPYTTVWSGEDAAARPVIARSGGIAYADEVLGDRDSRGILLTRDTSTPGQGTPVFGQVHGARQRRVMRRKLCQVCANPADNSDDGVLWILMDHREDWPNWPDRMAVTEPPICRTCAEQSARRCPALRRGHVLVRAGSYPLCGVLGLRYLAGDPFPIPGERVLAGFDDPGMGWILAGQYARELNDCTILEG